MHIPLINGIIGANINPQTDNPIKKDIITKINVDDIDAINISSNVFEIRSLKSLKNKIFINFKVFSSAMFTNIVPESMPINKKIDNKINNLF